MPVPLEGRVSVHGDGKQPRHIQIDDPPSDDKQQALLVAAASRGHLPRAIPPPDHQDLKPKRRKSALTVVTVSVTRGKEDMADIGRLGCGSRRLTS